MKKAIFTIIYLLIICNANAFIGTANITIVDANRSNRNIPCDVYYPATSNGANTPIAGGSFALVVVAHGFLMGTDAYKYLGDSLCNASLIVVVVNTETGFNKSIQTFGADLAAVADNMIGYNASSASFFYNHIKNKAVVIGHSMGGLATFVSANLSANIVATVTMSAADSGNVASGICTAITKPNFSITGTIDCIAPPASNARMMYDALGSDCKYYMNITGGTHCGMADQNAICSLGESCIVGQNYISKPQQHRLILQPLYMYLDYYLNANNTSFASFTNYITSADSFVYAKQCTTVSIQNNLKKQTISITPNPTFNTLHISNDNNEENIFSIQTVFGEQILGSRKLLKNNVIDLSYYSAGIYLLIIENNLHEKQVYKFVKQL